MQGLKLRIAFLVCAVTLGQPLVARSQLEPLAALSALDVAPGIDVTLFACEPMITNPAVIDVDTHGRVWVAEIEWYRRSAKVPAADKIKVLEDTDGDGRADRATVFYEGVFCPMSLCVAGSKVYVATSPDLWVFEDANGDLKADGPPKKLLTGFGGINHDHGAHSLVLGPDHKWWMSHGDRGFDVTGTDGSHVAFQWGGVLRGELDGSRLELVAQNFRNPYEVCISSFGEAFLSDNDNDGNFSTRICWIMERGDYGWFGTPGPKVPAGTPFGEGWHFRAQVPGFVPSTLVTGFGSPCGICFYEGDAFGDEYKNAPWHTDAGPREVRVYPHQLDGAGMKAASRVVISAQGDSYFRPDDVVAAPDGSLYVSDWYDGGVGGHAYNNPDQGRIYLLRPANKKPSRIGQAGPFATVAEAIEGLKNANLDTQFQARERLLAEGAASVPALVALLESDEPNHAARALWVLDRIGGQAREHVIEMLDSDDARFRGLAVRILRRHGNEYSDRILPLANDSSLEVRREVLLAIPTLEGDHATEALIALASTYDGTDRYLLEAIHVAAQGRVERLVAALDERGLFTSDRIQLVQVLAPDRAAKLVVASIKEHKSDAASASALLTVLGGIGSIEAGREAVGIAIDGAAPREARERALSIIGANLTGAWQALRADRQLLGGLRGMLADPAWQEAALSFASENRLRGLSRDIVNLFDASDDAVRTRAIQAAARLGDVAAAERLESMAADGNTAVRGAALVALVDLQAWPALRKLITGDSATAAARSDAVERMMAGSAGAVVLRRWIDESAVSGDVQARAVALAASHPDSNVRVLYEKYIPEAERPERLGAAISAEAILALAGNEARGEQIFFKSTAAQCANCHMAKGFGAAIGPDLSAIGKKYDRKALLETILEPSKAIGPEFVPYIIETDAGLVHVGFLVTQDDRLIVLKDTAGKLIQIKRKEVVAVLAQEKSLMPELVLRDVTAQDAADLLAYLTTLADTLPSGK